MDNIRVAILWHFHQPVYYEELDRPALLPWVRLHALKDYRDMLSYIDEFPQLKLNFNFTPSLLEQLLALDAGRLSDRSLELARKPASALSPAERVQILKDFFLADWTHMVQPYARYHSLLVKRGKMITEDELASVAQRFTDQEITDLQVWFNLTWIDPSLRSELDHLYHKGSNFTPEDKQAVFDHQRKIISSIIPAYRKAWEDERIEITTSPFYHPILPLILDRRTAHVSDPDIVLPRIEFSHPEDCRGQLVSGLAFCEASFGKRPTGIWPPEGSVSEAIMPLMKESHVEWIATDEAILARSLGVDFTRDEHGVPRHARELYRPYVCNDVTIFFRDHVLSDLIGFTYHDLDADAAASDLVGRIEAISLALPHEGTHIIPIILDGENAWESYPDDGRLFLRALYSRLVERGVKTTTFSEYKRSVEPRPLKSLFAGSWIEASFKTWIGHPEKNRAWDILGQLRTKAAQAGTISAEARKRIHILEGSDWYWWFGTGEPVILETFDWLFRHYASSVYRLLGLEAPQELDLPLVHPETKLTRPIELINPEIDGKVSSYYEWYNAGMVDLEKTGGTMHRFASFFTKIYYGFDHKYVYIRADAIEKDLKPFRFRIDLMEPEARSFDLVSPGPLVFAVGAILELAIPLSLFGPNPPRTVGVALRAYQGDTEIDRSVPIRFPCTAGAIDLEEWSA